MLDAQAAQIHGQADGVLIFHHMMCSGVKQLTGGAGVMDEHEHRAAGSELYAEEGSHEAVKDVGSTGCGV